MATVVPDAIPDPNAGASLSADRDILRQRATDVQKMATTLKKFGNARSSHAVTVANARCVIEPIDENSQARFRTDEHRRPSWKIAVPVGHFHHRLQVDREESARVAHPYMIKPSRRVLWDVYLALLVGYVTVVLP